MSLCFLLGYLSGAGWLAFAVPYKSVVLNLYGALPFLNAGLPHNDRRYTPG